MDSVYEHATLSKTLEVEVVNGNNESVEPSANDSTQASTVLKDEPDQEPGSVGKVHDIYRTDKDKNGNTTWTDKYPEDVVEAAENSETEKYALIVRKQKSEDSRKTLEVHSILVQSAKLRKALGDILEDYPGVSCELKRLKFESPFEPFVHRWEAFSDYMNRDDLDATTKEHLNLLYNVLQEEIGDTIKEFEDYVLNGVITYETLWMIFQPETLVVAQHDGALSAFEQNYTAYEENNCGKYFRIDGDCVDWDGSKFCRYNQQLRIWSFGGSKKIRDLNVLPMKFYHNKEELKLDLIERGKKFEQLSGCQYKLYVHLCSCVYNN
jgi:hypothetical protein